MNITVVGAGRVGLAMARDLAADGSFRVTVADRDPVRLRDAETRYGLRGERLDASLPSTVGRAVSGADLAISAVPGFLGYRTLEAMLDAGTNVVDIAFFSEDPLSLAPLAVRRGVTAVVDAGVAPGLSNLLVGHAVRQLDRTDRIAIYVGGLPADPQPPYEYRAVFSPIDVIEEYTRPARVVVDGRTITKPPLSEIEGVEVPGVGRLEAFLTDGLRTLTTTIDCPNMIEKTLRYPGHAEKMRLLRDTGLFATTPMRVDDVDVRPIDVTTALLFPLWQMEEGEEDVTVLRVLVEGLRSGASERWTYDLVDRYDRASQITSMARTTGYTATMIARLLVSGHIETAGVLPPEGLAQVPGAVDHVLDGLRARGIVIRHSIDRLDSTPS